MREMGNGREMEREREERERGKDAVKGVCYRSESQNANSTCTLPLFTSPFFFLLAKNIV